MALDILEIGAKPATNSDRINYPPLSERTATDSAVLARGYGFVRDLARVLNEEILEGHREAQEYDLAERAQVKAKKSVASLLHELSRERGMAWRDIAGYVDVSVSAVRKWRHDGAAAPENRLALARLAAFLDLLEGFMVENPAGWLELPMADGYTVRHMDLYAAGHPDLLLDIAGLRLNETTALDQFDHEWRTKYRSDFEVFESGDGNLSIRKK